MKVKTKNKYESPNYTKPSDFNVNDVIEDETTGSYWLIKQIGLSSAFHEPRYTLVPLKEGGVIAHHRYKSIKKAIKATFAWPDQLIKYKLTGISLERKGADNESKS